MTSRNILELRSALAWILHLYADLSFISRSVVFTVLGDAHSKGICEDYKDTILCRRCDVEGCRYGRLGQTCTFARITHLFDNGAAVFLDFMSLWGCCKCGEDGHMS
ncbi:anoctamin-2-like isoform X1 [Tachypleus tridentatus]|uniref:anoctamin-2-like isoform X1 n=1 Tax=Tachypleus tridentatus TaxID=6853 RepID=UPI003FD345B9